MSIASKGRTFSEEQRRKISEAGKGRRLSEEVKKKMSIAKMGHSVSDEARERMSVSHLGKVLPIEQRNKIRKSNLLRWATMPNLLRKLRIEEFKENSKFVRRYTTPSSIEIMVRKYLKRLDIKFEEQKSFWPYVVDFFLADSNLAVECDGTYWHISRPGASERDARRDKYLSSRYEIRIVRIPEKDIRKNPLQSVLDYIVRNM